MGKNIKQKIKELEEQMSAIDFWNNKEKATAVIKELNKLRADEQEVGKYDSSNAIITIFSGAGGDDAEDFSAILFSMYEKFIEKKGWQIYILHKNKNDHGGYRNITFETIGKNSYGILKNESGVHRVQRVPITESSGRIHTSTVTVAVLLDVGDKEFHIEPKGLKIETYRASGHGGQNVQKVETAVRITHLPTNTVATCQSERSQFQNKESCRFIAILLDYYYKQFPESLKKYFSKIII